MTSYTTSDLSRRPDDIIADATRGPVTITLEGKPRLVLLGIDDYHRLLAKGDVRTAGTIDTMPDALFDEVKRTVEGWEHDSAVV